MTETHIDGLAQDGSNPSVLAMVLLQYHIVIKVIL